MRSSLSPWLLFLALMLQQAFAMIYPASLLKVSDNVSIHPNNFGGRMLDLWVVSKFKGPIYIGVGLSLSSNHGLLVYVDPSDTTSLITQLCYMSSSTAIVCGANDATSGVTVQDFEINADGSWGLYITYDTKKTSSAWVFKNLISGFYIGKVDMTTLTVSDLTKTFVNMDLMTTLSLTEDEISKLNTGQTMSSAFSNTLFHLLLTLLVLFFIF